MTRHVHAISDDTVLAWHFVGATLRDGRPVPPDGEWLVHDGPLVMCESGLHASEHVFDALSCAPGATLCRVELRGVKRDPNKVVARERRILARIDATTLLRDFARQCALDVVHLWYAPRVVRDYLTTGDESLRAAAWDAAWDAPWDAAMAASRAASRAAARAAAWAASRAAAWAASRAAPWDAARAASRAAARAAAWDAQRTRFSMMVDAAFAGQENQP